MFTLRRVCYGERATQGVLIYEGRPICVTLEPPWKNNEDFISCIPTGKYDCKRYSSHDYPNTWEIVGVQDRDFVLFHVGNYPRDTEGCILLGTNFAIKRDAIWNSGAAVKMFMDLTRPLARFGLTVEHGG